MSLRSLKAREGHLRRTYGLTLAEYNRILSSQDGKCAVCRRSHDTFKVNLAVDHDHRSREIYGLLCTYCNRRVIGRERRWEIFDQAAKYLRSGLGIYVPVAKKRYKKRIKKKSRSRSAAPRKG